MSKPQPSLANDPVADPDALYWLEALPVAACVIVLHSASYSLGTRNCLFAKVAFTAAPVAAHQALEVAISALRQDPAKPQQFAVEIGHDPAVRSYQAILRALPTPGDEPLALLTLIDRTQERNHGRQLRGEMLRDSLTGLPNRSGFDDACEAALAGVGGPYAIVILDMLRFSRINDSIGDLAGDELLITLARRLRGVVRDRDIVGRVGGNEFAVFGRLSDSDQGAQALVTRIKAELEAPCRIGAFEIGVEGAIGYSIETDGTRSPEAVFREAQIALKRAKSSGRIERYEADDAVAATRRFAIETRLRQAIAAEELRLHFQPLLSLETGHVAGFEALARWTLDGEAIPPSTFIPVAEESGLILPLGRWVIREATRTLADWDGLHGTPLPIYVGVNVSPHQLTRDDLVACVAGTIADAGIAGNRLMLEITESALIADPERAAQVLAALKEIGVRIAMDDFGTGYSNLANLRRLPIDVLKIDASLVTTLADDCDKASIVRAILSLAQSLGLQTTAEGIETAMLADRLTSMGCTYGQGYAFARALAPTQAYEFLTASLAHS